MTNRIRRTRLHIFALLLRWFVTHQGSSAQTSLFRGYQSKGVGKIDDVVTTTFSNGLEFPLVGVGAGNLPRNLVEKVVYEGLQDDHRIRMVDTSQASGNQREVARGIVTGIKDFKASTNMEGSIQYHVVTKIWYTYLGYERTKIAVEEILEDLQEAINDPNVDLRLTLLIHWPRCYDHIPWMNCEEEEQHLPERVKQAGPPPHLDKANAWKESWRALEEYYNNADYSPIVGIGVSNFDRDDLTTLVKISKTMPHVAQVNVWMVFNNTPLIDDLSRNGICVQVYNAMHGLTGQLDKFPKAHHQIQMIEMQLVQASATGSSALEVVDKVHEGQVVLKWLIQTGISVIPRTSNLDRLSQNSAVALMRIPNMNEKQLEIVGESMLALTNNKDLGDDAHVEVLFHAKTSDLFLYWIGGDSKEKHVTYIEKGTTYKEKSHPGHQFKVYKADDPDQYQTVSIYGAYGDTQDVHVEF